MRVEFLDEQNENRLFIEVIDGVVVFTSEGVSEEYGLYARFKTLDCKTIKDAICMLDRVSKASV